MEKIIGILGVVLILAGCDGGGGGNDPTDGDTDGEDAVELDVIDDGEETETPVEVAPPTMQITTPSLGLTPVAWEAVAIAPDWLQDDLAINLNRLQTMYQNEMAAIILDLEDDRLIDEVAFVIAHSSPEVLEYTWFFSEVIVQNAELIYAYDPLLDYVTLEDVGTPGLDPDFYTTATYRVETSTGIEERTIDPQIYYWYIVHPRLEDEMPWYVNGWASGDATRPDLGWFWREFLWDAAAEDCPSERTCPLLSEQMPAIEVFKRLGEDSAYDADAQQQVYAFTEEVLDFGAGEERPTQPNRIYVVACGNCGEYADFHVAALRTALIPARNAGAKSNDHTWSEWWYEGDDWHGETWFYSNGIRRDRRDNDCDGLADDGLDDDDEDGDGYGLLTDCDDTDDSINPGATEVLNGYDDDCDGIADDGFTDADLDGDGDGFSFADGDCRENDDAVFPGAVEVMDNGIDDDCDTVADAGVDTSDADTDGFSIADGDCDDTNVDIYPGTFDILNAVDDDCDGLADEDFTEYDRDGDGFTMAAGDCNDLVGGTHPDADDPYLSTNRLYVLTTTRGDSLLNNDRTPAYATLPATLEFEVLDYDSNPVDGAMVTVYGTWAVYGYPDQWAVASEVFTGIDGQATLPVGESNPYGYSIKSAIGDTPGEGYLNVATNWLPPYETQLVSRIVPGNMPAAAAATEVDLTDGADPEMSVSVQFSVESYRLAGDGMLFGHSSDEREGGTVDAFVLDVDNYSLFASGAPFEAHAFDLDATDMDDSFDLPRTKNWIFVISNTSYLASTMVGSVTVTASAAGDIVWNDDGPTVSTRLRLPPDTHIALTLMD